MILQLLLDSFHFALFSLLTISQQPNITQVFYYFLVMLNCQGSLSRLSFGVVYSPVKICICLFLICWWLVAAIGCGCWWLVGRCLVVDWLWAASRRPWGGFGGWGSAGRCLGQGFCVFVLVYLFILGGGCWLVMAAGGCGGGGVSRATTGVGSPGLRGCNNRGWFPGLHAMVP